MILTQIHQPDLILLDMMLSDLSANRVLDYLKHDSKTATIPIIAVTPLAMTQDDKCTIAILFDFVQIRGVQLPDFFKKSGS
ncbi:MAG: hypothetical protein V7L29_15685 [Nostoc sp.]|uniref:hypothetical protein n=1 Tax=Nostoc sp. TaxID=1180 RepID=UPI002FF4FDD0